MIVDHTRLPLSAKSPDGGLAGFVTPFGGKISDGSYGFETEGMSACGRLVCVEPGLSIISFHGRFNAYHRLVHDHTIDETDDLFFLQYWPDPHHTVARLTTDGYSFRSFTPRQPVVTIVKNKTRLEIDHEAGAELKGICLLFNRDWILRHFGGEGSDTANRILCGLHHADERNLSATETGLARTLFNALEQHSLLLQIKADTFSLLSQFYEETSMADEDGSHADRLRELAEVEKELMKALHRALPFLDDLAKAHYMSTSTLKRRFKQVYGLTIQEYYLTRKMELARSLLAEDITVHSVSTRLGYKSSSHFITLFKKFHGFPPGHLRKTEAEH